MSYINDFMQIAIEQARKAYTENEIPVGCVIVKDGKIIFKSRNSIQKNSNPICHAEILCINGALKKLNQKYLYNCDLYVTLEPCPMCMGAIMASRIARVYIGAQDNNFGACGTMYNLCETLNHKCEVYFGINEDECKNLLQNFFEKILKK